MKNKKLTFRFADGSTRTIIIPSTEKIIKQKQGRPRMPVRCYRGCKTKIFYISECWLGKKAWLQILKQFKAPKETNEATLQVINAFFRKEPPDLKLKIDFHNHQAKLDDFYRCPSPYKKTAEELNMKLTIDELKEVYDKGYYTGQHELNNELLRLGLLKKPDWIEGEIG